MFILVMICIWVLGSYKLEVLAMEPLSTPLSFCLQNVAKSLCSHLCQLIVDAIVELHSIDEKMFN